MTFLLAVIVKTPKSCHSKQQHFTAHKLHSSTTFILHNYNISHNIDSLTPSAPQYIMSRTLSS